MATSVGRSAGKPRYKRITHLALWCKILGMKNLMLILLVAVALTGCGLKGDLYLPADEQTESEQVESSPADSMESESAVVADEEADGARP